MDHDLTPTGQPITQKLIVHRKRTASGYANTWQVLYRCTLRPVLCNPTMPRSQPPSLTHRSSLTILLSHGFTWVSIHDYFKRPRRKFVEFPLHGFRFLVQIAAQVAVSVLRSSRQLHLTFASVNSSFCNHLNLLRACNLAQHSHTSRTAAVNVGGRSVEFLGVFVSCLPHPLSRTCHTCRVRRLPSFFLQVNRSFGPEVAVKGYVRSNPSFNWKQPHLSRVGRFPARYIACRFSPPHRPS